jgi:cytochrome c-type biogenesis protein CcmH
MSLGKQEIYQEGREESRFLRVIAPLRTLSDGCAAIYSSLSFFAGLSPRTVAIAVMLAATQAHAVSDPREMLPDAKMEARAEQVGSQLRCLVCQNESIEDSNADLAKDLRAVVRKRVAAGDSDAQIMTWMTARYGSFIRLKPPISAGTLLLWGTPVLALMAGAAAALLGNRARQTPPAPLSDAEQTRLAELSRPA